MKSFQIAILLLAALIIPSFVGAQPELKAIVDAPRFENNVLKDVKSAFIGYVKVSRFTPKESVDCIHSPSGYFPDPILEDSSIDLQRDATQPVWITVSIPKDAATGLYNVFSHFRLAVITYNGGHKL